MLPDAEAFETCLIRLKHATALTHETVLAAPTISTILSVSPLRVPELTPLIRVNEELVSSFVEPCRAVCKGFCVTLVTSPPAWLEMLPEIYCYRDSFAIF